MIGSRKGTQRGGVEGHTGFCPNYSFSEAGNRARTLWFWKDSWIGPAANSRAGIKPGPRCDSLGEGR